MERWELEEDFGSLEDLLPEVPDVVPADWQGPHVGEGPDPMLRNALEMAFDLVEQGATPEEAQQRVVETFSRQPEAMRRLAMLTDDRFAEARAAALDPRASAEYIERVVEDDTGSIRRLAGFGSFDSAARRAHQLGDQLEFQARERPWERGMEL